MKCIATHSQYLVAYLVAEISPIREKITQQKQTNNTLTALFGMQCKQNESNRKKDEKAGTDPVSSARKIRNTNRAAVFECGKIHENSTLTEKK